MTQARVHTFASTAICFSMTAFFTGSAIAASYSACGWCSDVELNHGRPGVWTTRRCMHVRGNSFRRLQVTEPTFRELICLSWSGVERTTRRSLRRVTCLAGVKPAGLLGPLQHCALRCAAAHGSLIVVAAVGAIAAVKRACIARISRR